MPAPAFLPDVQAAKPEISIDLTKVGVTDVKKIVEVARDGKRPIVLMSTFSIFVDLPSNRKGANLSRNFEAIDEVLEEALTSPVYEIEELCGEVARRLLLRHEYASRSEVRMKSELMIKKKTPKTALACQEVVDIYAQAVATRRNGETKVKKTIGVEKLGITACPCAQEISRKKARDKLKQLGVDEKNVEIFLKEIPMATHNQRGRGIIFIEVDDGYEVPIEKLITIIEQSMSSQTFELLKRKDEAEIVETAHKNPKFVEDCVRLMAQKIVKAFPNLPDDALITIRQINEESIHRHNAFAERVASMGDLRKELIAEDEG
jgi:GTP cyclohydrolase-4